MEEVRQAVPRSPDRQALPGNATVAVDETSGRPGCLPDSNVLDKAAETQGPQAVSPEPADRFGKQLEDISNELKDCKEQISHLRKQTEELKVAEQIISELSTRNRELSEQFHEREIRLPGVAINGHE